MGNKLIALLFIVGILLFIGAPVSAAEPDRAIKSRTDTQKINSALHDGNAI
ncbi:hypothetical protein [Microbulbifer epialgicus]|uniref:Uncharacterized protein n=1 Tax=Microbulbifer epialgicus TaxID=393907 RepID=A0ABV4NX17_9GAMM